MVCQWELNVAPEVVRKLGEYKILRYYSAGDSSSLETKDLHEIPRPINAIMSTFPGSTLSRRRQQRYR
jgi:hypothetical protein